MNFLTGNDMVIVSPAFTEADGETGSATDSTPTVTATSAAGQALTVGAVTALDDDGRYSVTVQAVTNPDRITVVWSGAVSSVDQQFTQRLEVAGGVYLGTDELADLPDIDSAKHGMDVLQRLRDEFESIAERWCGQAFVPRFATAVLRDQMMLPHKHPRSILSATDGAGTTLVTTSWRVTAWGAVLDSYDSTICATYPVTVVYTHGDDAPPPELVAACRDFVRAKVFSSASRVGPDVLRITDPSGITEQYSTPDWSKGRPTGLLDVDRTLVALGSPMLIA